MVLHRCRLSSLHPNICAHVFMICMLLVSTRVIIQAGSHLSVWPVKKKHAIYLIESVAYVPHFIIYLCSSTAVRRCCCEQHNKTRLWAGCDGRLMLTGTRARWSPSLPRMVSRVAGAHSRPFLTPAVHQRKRKQKVVSCFK